MFYLGKIHARLYQIIFNMETLQNQTAPLTLSSIYPYTE